MVRSDGKLDHLGEETGLGLEIVMDECGVDLGTTGDAAQRGLVIALLGELGHLGPGGVFGHLQAGLFEQVGAVVGHRAFGIEGQRVEGAIDRKAFANRGEYVVQVVVVREVGHRSEPTLVAPQRGFVHTDGQHVELPTVGGDVGGQALTQDVFLQHHPVELDVGVLPFEGLGEALHADHVRVVDGGDGEGFGGLGHAERGDAGGAERPA